MKYPGYAIKVLINGAHYATNGVDVDETVQGLNVTDSEGLPGCAGGVGGVSYNITNSTNAANCVVTLTATPSQAIIAGMQVTLAGVTGATALDGAWEVTAANMSANTVTINNPTAPGTGSAGTLTVGGLVSVGTQAKVGGPSTATITIKKPTWDDAQNPYNLSPFLFGVGTYDRIQIYPQGVGSNINAEPLWDFYSALTTRLTLNNDVNALEPLSVTYESDGGYLIPYKFP